jgi:hypothetical protein
MKTIKMCVLAAGLLVLAAHEAKAGQTSDTLVTVTKVSSGGGTATGDMGAVHNSRDITQWIGCTTYYNGSATPFAFCNAVDVSGNYLVCNTSAPAAVEALLSLTSDSSINFSADANGNCSSVAVYSYSSNNPKR